MEENNRLKSHWQWLGSALQSRLCTHSTFPMHFHIYFCLRALFFSLYLIQNLWVEIIRFKDWYKHYRKFQRSLNCMHFITGTFIAGTELHKSERKSWWSGKDVLSSVRIFRRVFFTARQDLPTIGWSRDFCRWGNWSFLFGLLLAGL